MSLLRQPYPPRGYQSQMSMYQQKIGADLGAPPDSDTDSGICADSDQSSPRQGHQPSFPSSFPVSYSNQRLVHEDSRDYLTPNSARRLFGSASDSPRRTLPPRPGTAAATVAPRNGKQQFRVRFADQVGDSAASTSSTSSERSTSSPRQQPPTPSRARGSTTLTNPLYLKSTSPTLTNSNVFPKYQRQVGMSEKRYDSLPRPQSRRPNTASYSIDDIESLPEPPTYNLAMQRLRTVNPSPPSTPPKVRESVRDSLIRQNTEYAINKAIRNRSSSLPRASRTDQLAAFYGERPDRGYPGYQSQLSQIHQQEQLLGSLDNLRISGNDEYDTLGRRRLPVAPLRGSAANIPDAIDAEMESSGVRQPAYLRAKRQQRGRVPQLGRRSASAGRYEDQYAMEYRLPEANVRAQLVALDQRGFRTVLVEKTQPGPFGFYIATGVMNGKRGIFISRVSLPSLSPMLSVGDEILYVDDELVKGRSLEYVQSLIAGKTAVVIVLLPTVGAAFC